MEPEELEELQAYLNQNKKNKKIITMPQTYYVAYNEETEEYFSGLDREGIPQFSSNLEDAEWSFDEKVVEDYIELNNIEDVEAKPKQPTPGFNHPPKPPINF
jgi:hypothetical protein